MILTMGAIELCSNSYVSPLRANKNNSYICPDPSCKEPVIFKKGEIKRPHFAHHPNSKCCYYTPRPSVSQIHIEAQLKIKYLIEQKTATIKVNSNILNIDNISEVKLEYKFTFGCIIGRADVACLDKDGKIVLIIEIKNTHAQANRPEPWVELIAKDVVSNKTNIFTCCRKREKMNRCLCGIPCKQYRQCYTCYKKGFSLRQCIDCDEEFKIFSRDQVRCNECFERSIQYDICMSYLKNM